MAEMVRGVLAIAASRRSILVATALALIEPVRQAPLVLLGALGAFGGLRGLLRLRRRRGGGDLGVAREAQLAQPRGLGPHRRGFRLVVGHGPLAVLGALQLGELPLR